MQTARSRDTVHRGVGAKFRWLRDAFGDWPRDRRRSGSRAILAPGASLKVQKSCERRTPTSSALGAEPEEHNDLKVGRALSHPNAAGEARRVQHQHQRFLLRKLLKSCL